VRIAKTIVNVVITAAVTFSFFSCEKGVIEIPGGGEGITGYIWIAPYSLVTVPTKYRAADLVEVVKILEFDYGERLYGFDVDLDTGESFYLVGEKDIPFAEYLAKYSPDGQRVFTAPVPSGIYSLVFDPSTGAVWSYDRLLEPKLYRFSGDDGSLELEIDIDGYVIEDFAVDPRDGSVWYLTWGDDFVLRLVKSNRLGTEEVNVVLDDRYDEVCVDPKSGEVWIASDSYKLSKYNPDGGLITERPIASRVFTLAVVPSGGYLLVGYENSLELYDANGGFVSAWPYFGSGDFSFHTTEPYVFARGAYESGFHYHAFNYNDWTEIWEKYKPYSYEIRFAEK
jgi:hypothetical protein